MAPCLGARPILAGHEPFPSLVVDRWSDVVAANASALTVMSDGVAPHPLVPPVNALRVTVRPEGLAPWIVNFCEYATHLIDRLRRELATYPTSGCRRCTTSCARTRGWPARPRGGAPPSFVPLVLRTGEGGRRRPPRPWPPSARPGRHRGRRRSSRSSSADEAIARCCSARWTTAG